MESRMLDVPSGSRSINDTRLRRVLVLGAIKLMQPFRHKESAVLFLTSGLCVKYGRDIDLAEAHTMQFVASHTSIPVPKIHCAFRHNKSTFIVMDRVRGSKITDVWDGLSRESKDKIFEQLRVMLVELRAIPSPDDQITSIGRGSLWNSRLPTKDRRFGPFRDAQGLHRFLWNIARGGPRGADDRLQLEKFLDSHDKEWNRVVFTHGDLSSMNILVGGDEVVAIIDWETAGWYPCYWEYVCAIQVNPWNTFWGNHIDEFLKPWPEALAMEREMLSIPSIQ